MPEVRKIIFSSTSGEVENIISGFQPYAQSFSRIGPNSGNTSDIEAIRRMVEVRPIRRHIASGSVSMFMFLKM